MSTSRRYSLINALNYRTRTAHSCRDKFRKQRSELYFRLTNEINDMFAFGNYSVQQWNSVISGGKMLSRYSCRNCKRQLGIALVTRDFRRQSTTSSFDHLRSELPARSKVVL